MPSPPPPPPPPPLQTSHSNLALLLNAGPSPSTSTVRVKNIQSTIQGPRDAWGRPNRAQPISVSVTVQLLHASGSDTSAFASDALTPDTVHYGLLTKAVLSTLSRLETGAPLSLADVLAAIWDRLTGGLHLFTSGPGGGGGGGGGSSSRSSTAPPFLQLACLKSLELQVCLPKASLQGQGGASLTGHGVFANGALVSRGLAVKLHDLRVPILIGVNDNERLAKQAVVANVEVERFEDMGDHYCDLEGVVIEAMTTSSFETIEALLGHLAVRIKSYLVERHAAPDDGGGWHLRIAIEKPIAVVFADAPCVELEVGTNHVAG
ncbi:hypothetical protein E4U41_002373 [Claviceps citrina]|nr:hypothetical protein E4U41_002373 [Claviceps citrina]